MRSLYATKPSPLPMMLMETAIMLMDDEAHFLLMPTPTGTWRLPTEIVLDGESMEEATLRYIHQHCGLAVSELEMIDMTMNDQHLKKVTALFCAHVQTTPTGLQAFSFNTLPASIEPATIDYLASYVAKKTI